MHGDRQWKITVCQIVCVFVPTILLPIYLVGERLSGVTSHATVDKIMFYKEPNNVWGLILNDGLGLQQHDWKQISMPSSDWWRNKRQSLSINRVQGGQTEHCSSVLYHSHFGKNPPSYDI